MFRRVSILIIINALVTNFCMGQVEDDPLRVPYRIVDKWGFANINAKLVIPAIYDSVSSLSMYSEPIMSVFKKENNILQSGIVDYDGTYIVPLD